MTMPSRSLPAASFLMVLQACLPPPRAWEVDGSEDTGVAVQVDDTASTDIPCSSIKFMPNSSEGGDEAWSYLKISNDALTSGSFAVDGSFTVEFYSWIIDVGLGETRTLVSLGNDRAWWLKIEGAPEADELVFAVKAGDGEEGDDEFELRVEAPSSGAWHHIAVVYDADLSPKKVSLYVDGTREAQETIDGSWPGPDPDDDVLRVARANDGSPSWAAQVDLFRYAQAARHQGLNTTIEPETATDGWQGIWHFSGDTANALTGVLSEAQNVTFDDWCPNREGGR